MAKLIYNAIMSRRTHLYLIRHRRGCRKASRSLGFTAQMFRLMFGPPNLPVEQRVLNDACNRASIPKRTLAKALRLGADLNAMCALDGSPSLALYARHGREAFGAALLVKHGARLDATNHKKRQCAHVAIQALNKDIVLWCHRTDPDLFKQPDSSLLLPWDMLMGEFSGGWCPPEDRLAFRNECLALMDECERDRFTKNALRSFCLLLNERKYDDIETDILWLESLRPQLSNREQAIEWIGDDCDPPIYDHALHLLASFFFEHERLQLQDASPQPASRRSKKTSI
jgi:hypothetical protein